MICCWWVCWANWVMLMELYVPFDWNVKKMWLLQAWCWDVATSGSWHRKFSTILSTLGHNLPWHIECSFTQRHLLLKQKVHARENRVEGHNFFIAWTLPLAVTPSSSEKSVIFDIQLGPTRVDTIRDISFSFWLTDMIFFSASLSALSCIHWKQFCRCFLLYSQIYSQK